LDNLGELANLFAERNNPTGQSVFVGDYLEDGTIRIKENILLKRGKYINAIPHCTCTHSEGGCDHAINIKPGDRCVVLRAGKLWIAIAKVR